MPQNANKTISDTASSLLTLLNNANELIVYSSDRQNSSEVIKALQIYAKSKNFNVPEEKIEQFLSVILDARPITLTSIIKDIARDIINTDKKSNSPKVQKKS